jgi:hypothetical protein
MTTFVVIDEAEYRWAEVFLPRWLELVGSELTAYLGRSMSSPVPVVLSDHPRHEMRFPPRDDEDRALNTTAEGSKFEWEDPRTQGAIWSRSREAGDLPRH